jgi:hypothetical protein
MSAEKERRVVRKVIRAWSDQPECDKLGSHEEEELTDKLIAKAAPAIRAQERERAREALIALPVCEGTDPDGRVGEAVNREEALAALDQEDSDD